MTDKILICLFFILTVQHTSVAKLLTFNLNKPAGQLTASVARDIFGKYGYPRNFDGNSHISIEENQDDCNFIRVDLPMDPYNMNINGGSFEIPLQKTNEIMLTFQVKFSTGFKFGSGGYMHGICTGQCRDGFKVLLG